MSAVREFPSVTLTNNSNLVQINTNHSNFSVVPGSVIFIAGDRPRLVTSGDTVNRTLTLSIAYAGIDIVEKSATLIPLGQNDALLAAITSLTEAQNGLAEAYGNGPGNVSEISFSVITDPPATATRWPAFSEVTGKVSKDQLPQISAKADSLAEAKASTDLEVGEVIETVSYHGDIGSVMLARGGNLYLKISGQSNTEDGCRYVYTDDGNTLVGLFPDGFIRPEQAGAKGDGTTNDGAAIQAANALMTPLLMGLKFSSKDYFVGTYSFEIDVMKGFWHGETQTRINFSGAPSTGYGLRLKGANVYEYNDRMVKSALKNISVVGASKNNEYDADGIQLSGGSHNSRLSCCSLDWVAVQGFKRTFRFNDYCWKIHLNTCRTIGGVIETSSTASDFGECMVLRDCFFADSSGAFSHFRKGEWKCFGTSFDNQPFAVHNDAIFSMNQCHIENPGNQSTTPKYVEANNIAKVMIRDTWITTNNRALIEPALVSNCPEHTTGGIFLDNVTWNMTGDYNTRSTEAHNFIIGGDGRCGMQAMNWLNFQTYYGTPCGRASNMLGNGSFEQGDNSGWAIRVIDTSPSGGNASCSVAAIATNDVPKGGSYVGKVTSTYGGDGGIQGGELYQSLPCKGGDFLTGGVYLKNDWDASNDNGLFQVIAYFYDASGNRISYPDKYGFTKDSYVAGRYESLVSDWTYRHIGEVVPKGAARVEICVQVLANQDTPSTINAWVDEFHAEIQAHQ